MGSSILQIAFDTLAGNLVFTNVQLIDSKQQLSGKYGNRMYVCALMNELLGTAVLGSNHLIIPSSGTCVTDMI